MRTAMNKHLERPKVIKLLLAPVLIVSALIGCVCLLICLPIAFVNKQFYVKRIARGTIARWWFALAAVSLEWMCGLDIRSNPIDIDEDKSILVICNHNCRLDWMFFWCLAARYKKCNELSIAVKSPLRKAPIFGWAMQAFCFIFLGRENKDTDLKALSTAGTFRPTFLLLFPEGTDLSDSNVKKSQAFGSSLNPVLMWSNVLIPKVLGVHAALLALEPSVIYDVTIQYTNYKENTRPTEFDCFTGNLPKAVHFHVDRLPVPDLSLSDSIKEWLLHRWTLKEERLASSFSEAEYKAPAYTYSIAIILWCFLGFIFFVGLWFRREVRWFLFFVVAIWHFLITKLLGGLDKILTN